MAKVTVIFADRNNYSRTFDVRTLVELLFRVEIHAVETTPSHAVLNGNPDASVNHKLEDGDVVILTTR